MPIPAESDKPPPPCLAALRSGLSEACVKIAAPFQPSHAIGLSAPPSILSQTLDYLSGYYVPSEAPQIHILEVVLAGADVRAWADDTRPVATQIEGTRLAMAGGVCGNVSWHARFEEAAFADLTIFLPDRTVIFTSDNDLIPPHLALARLVRNRLSSDWSLSGAAYLHAGCVAIGGRGVVILGDKFSGKTTQICELVSRGANFTSNDRIFIFPGGRVVGLPVSVNIRPATLERYDRLEAWRGARSANPHRVGMNVPDSDVSLSVGQFAEAFGATIRPAVPLHAVIKLVRGGGATTRATEIQETDVVDLMASSLFDGVDYSQPYWGYRRSSTGMIADVVGRHVKLACEIRVGDGQIGECARLIEDRVLDS
jgi:hypothetical protein